MQIVRHEDIHGFTDRVQSWLMKDEAEYNLILALMDKLRRDNHGFGDPMFLASIEDGGEVVGCAWRTPPYSLGLTRLPADSIPLLVEKAAEVYGSLPAVLGAGAEARAFADCWSRLQGCAWSPGIRFGIHTLHRLEFPARSPQGRFRPATGQDAGLLADWFARFTAETGMTPRDDKAHTASLIEQGNLFLWEDSEPRCMAARVGKTPHGVRIGGVYTPLEWRNSGYASVTVASLCLHAMEAGSRFCFLYTDLDNPVSNGVYRKIGFKPVSDVLECRFTP